MQDSPITLKGEMSMLNVLHLHDSDIKKCLVALEQKRDEAPQFFMKSPVVVDCSELLGDTPVDFYSLYHGLRGLSFVPVGLRHLDSALNSMAIESGWSILRDSVATQSAATAKVKTESVSADVRAGEGVVETPQTSNNVVTVVKRPVRSGQQVYSADGDIVVLSQTSAGSEILASGSVHVYGKLCGRVLAGVNGNESARIFCQGLEAELIAIAGRYQLLDEVDTPLKGQPAMIYLDGEKLKIEAIV